MIPNALTIPIGLWLAYSAIFVAPPLGGTSDLKIVLCGAAIAVLAFLARSATSMAWQTNTNIILGLGLILFAGARMYFGDAGLNAFWVVLLSGIITATGALWSILYRPGEVAAETA